MGSLAFIVGFNFAGDLQEERRTKMNRRRSSKIILLSTR
jgi:hypothetical protein